MSRISRRSFLRLSAVALTVPALPRDLLPVALRPVPASPARDFFLLECHVAGTSYVPIEEIEPYLEIGQRLTLQREPGNVVDALAVLVLDARGVKLGYLPRARNEVPARLLDAGKELYARLERKQWFGGWLRVTMHVHMRES